MEDLKRSINMEKFPQFSGVLQKLLLLDYPYPAVLDKAAPENREGYDV